MKRLWARLRPAWRVLWRSNQLEAEMQQEMRFHLEQEAARLMREHRLGPAEARRLAHVRFGGVEKHKEAARDARGRQWLDAISLDARLGVRMLLKYRGLTLVGGFAMAVAIAIGATFFEVITQVINPALPLADGGRVVALQYSSGDGPERRVLHDFVEWRDELVSVEQLGAFRTVQHNLVAGNATPEPIVVAEITASAFVVARTPPLAGRYLLPDDERGGAAPVVVIGEQAWQSRFGADPHIVGRTIILGGVPSTVVGVMPEAFRFPVRHQFWIPLRANPVQYERLQGPAIYMFGRLAPGVTMEEAQAELSTIGQRAAKAHPVTHERLRPLILPYTREHLDLAEPGMVSLLRMFQILVGALSFVVAVNLAILVYARTVTRLGEIAVRTALGASRRRILAQLFVEALALSCVGAAAGLLLARIGLAYIKTVAVETGELPFWITLDLSAGTAMYAVGLAAFAALIMGVVPGLKATGKRVNVNLRELDGAHRSALGTDVDHARRRASLDCGGGAAGGFLPDLAGRAIGTCGSRFHRRQFVVGTAALGVEPGAVDGSRIRQRQVELMSRLQAEAGVASVTYSSHVPGLTAGRRIQFDDGAVRPSAPPSAGTIDVAPELFDAYDAEMLSGRAFTAADLGAADAVIVNRTFEQTFMPGRSALGLRFRYLRNESQRPGRERPQQSYQVVGVVRDFPSFPAALSIDDTAIVYHPAAPGDVHPVVLSIRFHGDIPCGFINRVRQIGAEVDPAMQLRGVEPLSVFYKNLRSLWRYLAWGIGLVTASVLLLSAAGIYALMSFTLARTDARDWHPHRAGCASATPSRRYFRTRRESARDRAVPRCGGVGPVVFERRLRSRRRRRSLARRRRDHDGRGAARGPRSGATELASAGDRRAEGGHVSRVNVPSGRGQS